MKKKMMIFGDSGFIGNALIEKLSSNFRLIGLSRSAKISLSSNVKDFTHISFDLERDNITHILESFKPEFILTATRGNFDSQLKLHNEIANYSIKENTNVYFLSTTNVFDKNPSRIYFESDIPYAQSDYGNYKIKCENLLLKKIKEKAVIIRLPKVFGDVNSPRINDVVRAISEKNLIEVYDNLFLSSIYISDLTELIEYIISKNYSGIFHLSSNDSILHKKFYQEITNDYINLKVNSIKGYKKFHLAIASERKELEHFSFNNADVISKIKKQINSLI